MIKTKTNFRSVSATYPQPLHPQLKATTISKIREYLAHKPNAHWLSANIGDTEYYFVEKIKEKEIKVPVIKTVIEYVLKEVPKEVPIIITKEIEKLVTHIVTKQIIRTRKKIIYRQTPEYLHKKREAQILNAKSKYVDFEKKITDLEAQIEILEKKASENIEFQEAKIGFDLKNKCCFVKEWLENYLDEIMNESISPVCYGVIRSPNNYVSWHIFLYEVKSIQAQKKGIIKVYMANTSTGFVFNDLNVNKKIISFFTKQTSSLHEISKEVILDIMKSYPKISSNECMLIEKKNNLNLNNVFYMKYHKNSYPKPILNIS